MLRTIRSKGIEIGLDEYSKLYLNAGGEAFLDIPSQQVILSSGLRRFLAKADESDGGTLLFSHVVDAEEVLSASRRVPREHMIALSELEAFQNAVDELAEQGARGELPPKSREIISGLRFPDPDKEPDLYRVYGTSRNPHLVVIWGCERSAGNSIAPGEAIEKLRRHATPRWKAVAGRSLGALLAILLLGFVAWAGYAAWPTAPELTVKGPEAVIFNPDAEVTEPGLNDSGDEGSDKPNGGNFPGQDSTGTDVPSQTPIPPPDGLDEIPGGPKKSEDGTAKEGSGARGGEDPFPPGPANPDDRRKESTRQNPPQEKPEDENAGLSPSRPGERQGPIEPSISAPGSADSGTPAGAKAPSNGRRTDSPKGKELEQPNARIPDGAKVSLAGQPRTPAPRMPPISSKDPQGRQKSQTPIDSSSPGTEVPGSESAILPESSPKLTIESRGVKGEKVVLRASFQGGAGGAIGKYRWKINDKTRDTSEDTIEVPIDKARLPVSVEVSAGDQTFRAEALIETTFQVRVTER